jgi:hypothetical protein
VRLAIFRHHRLRDLFPWAFKYLQCDFRKSRNFPSIDIAILRRGECCAPQIEAKAADFAQSVVPIQDFPRLVFVLIAAQYKQALCSRKIPVN